MQTPRFRSLTPLRLRRSPRRGLRPALETMEDRVTPVASLLDIAGAGVAGLPLPAGATLIAVSDSGQQVLFSSLDTNVVAKEASLPTVDNLYWMGLSKGTTNPTIRLVTHFAGSANMATGYVGVGNGLVRTFEAGTASMSGDGQYVVFDSRINAHSYDASVPVQNDQPDAPGVPTLFNPNPADEGTLDIFVWSATATDHNNNITAVSLLNSAGKTAAVQQIVMPGSISPDPTQPMVLGVFPETAVTSTTTWSNLYEPLTDTMNHGISDDGSRVLYSSDAPAYWIDTINPKIIDATPPDYTPDGFLVAGTNQVSAKDLETNGNSRTVTLDKDGEALGTYLNNLPYQQGTLPNELFEPEYLQLSGDGNLVVYSTRQTSANLVAGTSDSNFSLDVFAYTVSTNANTLVSRKASTTNVAAGIGQADYEPNADLVLFDSQNQAISSNGTTIAFTSSAGNLIVGFTNNSVEEIGYQFIFSGSVTPQPQPQYIVVREEGPLDIYGFRMTTQTTSLVNTPDGKTNTILAAVFGGVSGDGSTFLFSTDANNFYNPPFSSPPYPPFAAGTLPPNFLLGGFSNLWVRNIDTSTTTLVSVSADGKSSGNQATMAVAATPDSAASLAQISYSGRFVVFSSKANNLADGIVDKSSKGGVFLRDLQGDRTYLISAMAAGNTPSAGLITSFALATPDASGTTTVTLDGTLLGDMQTRFSTEYVSPPSHIYQVAFPLAAPASASANPSFLAVAGAGNLNNVVYEYRGTTRTTRWTPANVFLGYSGEVRVATGDVNGDGVSDYVYSEGSGRTSTGAVAVVDGKTNSVIWRFNPFGGHYRGGVYVATGDVNADGYVDVILGAGSGHSPEVKVYSGRRGNLLMDFLAYKRGMTKGVRVAGGDVDGDGYADVITGAGPGFAPIVNVFSGQTGGLVTSFRSGSGPGVYVAAADMTGDGKADIVTGSDGGSMVGVYGGSTGIKLGSYNAGRAFSRGTRVAARTGEIAIATGPGQSPLVRVVIYEGLQPVDQFTPFGSKNRYGLFLG